MKKRPLELPFPMKGIDKSGAYVDQAPHSCVDCLNVMPKEIYQGRVRGGSRPGLVKYLSNNFGAQVRMIAAASDINGPTKLVVFSNSRVTWQLVTQNPVTGVYEISGGYDFWAVPAAANFPERICSVTIGPELFFTGRKWQSWPFYFNGSTNAYGTLTTSDPGTPPTYCSIVSSLSGRLVVAGDNAAGRAYYMSRDGDPHDFEYTDTDNSRAITGNWGIGPTAYDSITAVIPWYGDYMVWCSANAIQLLVGDNPNTGAYWYPVTARYGCLDAMSWCKGPGGSLFIMSKAGLIMMNPSNPRSEPEVMSRDRLPDQLLGLDPLTHEVTMIWDALLNGVHIFVTKSSAALDLNHWFYSLHAGGYFRMSYPVDMEPFCAFQYNKMNEQETDILLGCRDGYIRRFDNSTYTDDGTNFDSNVLLGPFRPAGPIEIDGRIQEAVFTMAQDSGATTAQFLGGAYAEEASESSALYSCSLSGGRSTVHRPRVRCGDGIVKIVGTPGTPWAMERANLILGTGGRQRDT